jgi:tetratricopeptide (TPR) repeat protein
LVVGIAQKQSINAGAEAMISCPTLHRSVENAGPFFNLSRLSALVLMATAIASSGPACAGDPEDCNGPAQDKVEAACTALINDAQRPVEQRVAAFSSRARLYLGRSKFDSALSDADAALQLNPQFVPALLTRAYARQRNGSVDLARADLERAVELAPKNAIAFLARGNFRGDQKAWAEAIADYNQAIALRQDLPAAYVGRARAYVETAQLDQAMTDLNTALAMNPNVQNAFFWRGQAYRRKGDVDHAIEDFSRAIAQGPQNERAAYFARAQLFSAKGDYARAIADFDKLLTLMPDNKEIQQQRQSAIAMQAELARVNVKPPATAAAPPPSPVPMATLPSQFPAPAPINPQGNQIKQLIDQGNYAAAIERLNQLLAAEPHNEAALRARSLLYEIEPPRRSPQRPERIAHAETGRRGIIGHPRHNVDEPVAVRSGHGRLRAGDFAGPEQRLGLSRASLYQGEQGKGAGSSRRLRSFHRPQCEGYADLYRSRLGLCDAWPARQGLAGFRPGDNSQPVE